ncbi:MAG TPA: alpha/beta fold hydrolase [Solirubrobacteraceae bacterium]|nr:alpha/beta fold hydrolase [Solirubrobacteraceae bacterium]
MAAAPDMTPGEGVLAVELRGSGPRVVLVHGSITGRRTWQRQETLAEHWTLCVADRPGFGASPPLPRGDFEAEAPLFAALLQDGAHLVGHSYGAVIALHAAALAPDAVRSLTISEPGCLALAAHDPLVAQQLANGRLLYEHSREMTSMEFLRAYRGGVGSTHATPESLDGELLRGVELTMRERPPWESEPPLASLARYAFPKLVISGGHSHVFETVCDVVAERLGAGRAVIAGRAHSIPVTGAPYNDCLHRFLREAERSA